MTRKVLIILGFALAIWAFCGALIAIGRQNMSMEATLYVHAVGAPIGAAFFSWIYFRFFGFTGPALTASLFVGTAIAADFFIVALLIERSFEMFSSVLGVWIPQVLIFSATYLTGRLVQSNAHQSEGTRA